MIPKPSARFPLLALDLESVLVPEIWQAVAAESKLSELARTTRDDPSYERLMEHRLRVCRTHGLDLERLRSIAAKLEPFAEAINLLQEVRGVMPVVILSDTFYELAEPIINRLGLPMLLAHRLELDDQGFIHRIHLRQPDAKRSAVQAFQGLGFRVIAVGDSHNDLGMLSQADAPFWLRPPQKLREQHPDIPCLSSLDELRPVLEQAGTPHPIPAPAKACTVTLA